MGPAMYAASSPHHSHTCFIINHVRPAVVLGCSIVLMGKKRVHAHVGKGAEAQAPPHNNGSSSSLADLESWLKGAGISWDEKCIRLAADVPGCAGPALGIYATADVPAGARLCRIPKSAILSVVNSGCADILKTEQLGGGLALVVATLYEYCQGKQSPWYGYLRSLPGREYIPIFWSDDEQQLLEGTELEGRAQTDREAMATDWEDEVLPLAKKYPKRIPKRGWTFENFLMSASWMASRAFRVDDRHADALSSTALQAMARTAIHMNDTARAWGTVPLADVFNHKASVVHLSEEYRVAEDDDDDDDDDDEGHGEGEEEGDGENEDEEGESEGEEEVSASDTDGEKDGAAAQDGGTKTCSKAGNTCGASNCTGHHKSSQACIVMASESAVCAAQHGACSAAGADAGAAGAGVGAGSVGHAGLESSQPVAGGVSQHAPSPSPSEYTRGGVDLRLEIAICSHDDVDDVPSGALDILAGHDLVSGQQVHNTYGELGNAELLARYGFILDRNPFSEVYIDADDVLPATQQVISLQLMSAGVSGSCWGENATAADAAVGANSSSHGNMKEVQPADLQHKKAVGKRSKGKANSQQLSTAGLTGAAAEKAARKELQKRSKWIQDNSELLPTEGDSDEEDGSGPVQDPLVCMPHGCVNLPMWLLLQALTAPQSCWAAWQDSEQGVQAILTDAQAAAGTSKVSLQCHAHQHQHQEQEQEHHQHDQHQQHQEHRQHYKQQPQGQDQKQQPQEQHHEQAHDHQTELQQGETQLGLEQVAPAAAVKHEQQMHHHGEPAHAHAHAASNLTLAPHPTGTTAAGVVHLTEAALAARFSHEVPVPRMPPLAHAGSAGAQNSVQWLCSCCNDQQGALESKQSDHTGVVQQKRDKRINGTVQEWEASQGVLLVCPACCCQQHGAALSLTSNSPDGTAQYKWTGTMRAVLQDAALRRLERYHPQSGSIVKPAKKQKTATAGSAGVPTSTASPVQAYKQQLQERMQAVLVGLVKDEARLVAAAEPRGEKGAAIRVALGLRVSEQRMLLQLLQACS